MKKPGGGFWSATRFFCHIFVTRALVKFLTEVVCSRKEEPQYDR